MQRSDAMRILLAVAMLNRPTKAAQQHAKVLLDMALSILICGLQIKRSPVLIHAALIISASQIHRSVP